MFWASDAEVYAHGYIGTNQVIIAGQHGVKTVVDIRKRATSAHMQHDASRIRHTSQVCETSMYLRVVFGLKVSVQWPKTSHATNAGFEYVF